MRTSYFSSPLYSINESGRWVHGIENIEPLLYMLPSVIKGKKNNKTIIYVEDERSVDALRNIGFTATIAFGGLVSFSKFREKYAEQIKGAKLIIFPNNSNHSKQYSKTVYNSLKSCCKSIGIINLPDLKENTNYNSPIHVEDGCYYKNYKGRKIFITNFTI